MPHLVFLKIDWLLSILFIVKGFCIIAVICIENIFPSLSFIAYTLGLVLFCKVFNFYVVREISFFLYNFSFMSYLKWDIGEISRILLLSLYKSLLFEHITMNMYYLCYQNYFKRLFNNMGKYLESVVN